MKVGDFSWWGWGVNSYMQVWIMFHTGGVRSWRVQGNLKYSLGTMIETCPQIYLQQSCSVVSRQDIRALQPTLGYRVSVGKATVLYFFDFQSIIVLSNWMSHPKVRLSGIQAVCERCAKICSDIWCCLGPGAATNSPVCHISINEIVWFQRDSLVSTRLISIR